MIMNRKRILFLLVFLTTFNLQAKNLSMLWRSNIENFELLDVYIRYDLAFIPAGLGGLNIVDISDPTAPEVLSEYRAIGCDWGRMYSWAANEKYAFGAGRDCGIFVLDVSNPSNPRYLLQYSASTQGSLRYEHVEIQDKFLFLSRHQGGVEIVQTTSPISLRQRSIIPSENAWATLAQDSLLFIADGAAGIKIVNIKDKVNPVVLSSMKTSGTAKDLAVYGKQLFVAVGAAGVDMIDISNPEHPILRDNFDTGGYASRVSANESIVAVSDWEDVEILQHSNKKLERVGYKNTGGRVMAVALVDDIVYSAEWAKLTVYKYGDVAEADIDLNSRLLEFPRTADSETDTLSFIMQNNGGAELVINSHQVQNNDYSVHLNTHALPPGESTEISVVYQPGSGGWKGELILETNDPDEPSSKVVFSGNHNLGPMIGDPVPSFELESINGFGSISTDILRGRPVLLAFFTAW
jgi:hypothetical protein